MSTITLVCQAQTQTGMESANDQSDKDDRRREYNRLAQREFRKRRKEHLKNLENAQKEQNSEQAEEIERLRYENDELKRENEALKGQLYGTSSSPGLLSAPMNLPYTNRSFSISSSTSSLSGTGSPPQSMGGEMLPMTALAIPSTMPPPMSPFDTSYSMVHPSGLRPNSMSPPDAASFRTSSRSSGPSFQNMSLTSTPDPALIKESSQGIFNTQISPLTTYDKSQAQRELHTLFEPFYSDITVTSSPERHLAALFTLSATLPFQLQPSKAHLDTPHYYGIDMVASPVLRDRLLTVSADVAENFINDVGFLAGEDAGQMIIWGQDPLNETTWEFSQIILERWGWLLGRDWVARSNWWRRQRNAPMIPEW